MKKNLIQMMFVALTATTLILSTSCNKLKPDFAVDFFSKTLYVNVKATSKLGYYQIGTAQPVNVNIDSVISANGGGSIKVKKITIKEAHLDLINDSTMNLDALQSFAGMSIYGGDTTKIVYKTPMPQNGAIYVGLDHTNDDLVSKLNNKSANFAAFGNMTKDLTKDVTLAIRIRYSVTLGY